MNIAHGVTWELGREANLANWEDRVPIHEQSYGLAAYDDPAHLSEQIRADLAVLAPFLPQHPEAKSSGKPLAGLKVCHLQCHLGTDTISLARAGAQVTAVDFSPSALKVAADLAAKNNDDVTWVQSDVLDTRAAVTANARKDNSAPPEFDLVYTSVGTIEWLNDLNRWATQIAELLRPGGLFYIHDGHPFLYTLDDQVTDGLRIRYRYFGDGNPTAFDEETSYSGDGILEHQRQYDWPHPISETISALLGAGLQIMSFAEGTTIPWQAHELMVQDTAGNWAFPEPIRASVPVSFTLIARKA